MNKAFGLGMLLVVLHLCNGGSNQRRWGTKHVVYSQHRPLPNSSLNHTGSTNKKNLRKVSIDKQKQGLLYRHSVSRNALTSPYYYLASMPRPRRPNSSRRAPPMLRLPPRQKLLRSKMKTDYDNVLQYSSEQLLYTKLLGTGSPYLKNVRPTKRFRDVIQLEVGLSVMVIEELVERDQLMILAAALKLKWGDHYLSWKPEHFDNLTWIAVSSTEIWTPGLSVQRFRFLFILDFYFFLFAPESFASKPIDISIVNSNFSIHFVCLNSPNPFELTRKITTVDVNHLGEVGYFPSGRLMTRCNIHIAYFPFDTQHCEVLVESWIYPTNCLRFVKYKEGDTVDIMQYYTNHQWGLTGYNVKYTEAVYDNKNFSQVAFTFVLERKSQYYFMYFIFPQLLLACLQTLSHSLPVEHPGRMTMLTSLFIGTSVTQSGIANSIPKSSDSQSLLQIYMTIMSVNLVLGLIISTVMLYVVLRHPNEEPSLKAIIVALFSIVWPDDIDEDGLYCEVNENFDMDESPYGVVDMNSGRGTVGVAFAGPTKVHPILKKSQMAQKHTVIMSNSAIRASSDSTSSSPLVQKYFSVYDMATVNQQQEQQEQKNIEKLSKQRSRSSSQAAPQQHRNSRSTVCSQRKTRDLKRIWLVYCVALDKTIMYVTAVWNTVIPLLLFGVIPQMAVYEEIHQ